MPILNEDESKTDQHKRVKNFTRFINQHIKQLVKDTDLPKDITTYFARHSFSYNAIHKGASMELISSALGHSDLKTTQRYFMGFNDDSMKKLAEMTKI